MYEKNKKLIECCRFYVSIGSFPKKCELATFKPGVPEKRSFLGWASHFFTEISPGNIKILRTFIRFFYFFTLSTFDLRIIFIFYLYFLASQTKIVTQ